MSNTIKQTQKGNGHEDCQDCKRQKKENAALIGVYQRLQAVRAKATKVNSDIGYHMRNSSHNFEKFQLFRDKINNKPIQQEFDHEINTITMSLVGDIFQQQLRAKTERQNKKLQQLIHSMQNQRIRNKINLSQSLQKTNQMRKAINLIQPRIWNNNNITSIPLTKSMHIDENEKNSTNSTSFDINKQSKEKNKKQYYESLKGLWLYQNEMNTKLQQEFLMTRQKKSENVGTYKARRRASVLPALKNKRAQKQF